MKKIKFIYDIIEFIISLVLLILGIKLIIFILVSCFTFWAYMMIEMPQLQDKIILMLEWHSFFMVLFSIALVGYFINSEIKNIMWRNKE